MKTNAELSHAELLARIADLEARLQEAEETMQAIRRGEVDAVVVAGEAGDQVFTLAGADRPYRLLIEHMNEGALTLSGGGLVLFCNARFGAIVLAPPEKIVGRPFAEFIVPDDRATFTALASGSRAQLETRLRAGPDGEAPVQISISRVNIDGEWVACVAVADLTARKRDEAIRLEALRNASAYHRGLLEASLDPFFATDSGGKIQDVNSAAESITGRTRADLVYSDFAGCFTQPAEARAGLERAFRDGAIRDYPLEIRRSDGRVAAALFNASVYRDAKGQVLGVFAAAREVTELKKADVVAAGDEAPASCRTPSACSSE